MARKVMNYEEPTSDISGYDPLEGLLDEEPEQEQEELDADDVLSEMEEPEAEEEEEVESTPPQQPQVQPYNPNMDPNVAWARTRIVERERDTYKNRLDMLIAKLQEAQNQPVEEEDEDDYELMAPDEKASKLSEKALKKLEAMENQQKLSKQQAMLQNAIGVADAHIANFAMSNPQYTQAVAHLAYMEIDELLDENPGITPAEAEAKVMNKVQTDKLRWVSSGKNPGLELWKRAVRRGFVPQQMAQEEEEGVDETPVAPAQPKKPTAQEEVENVKKQRAKQQAARTIATVPGAQGRSALNAKTLAKMSEKDFLDKIADLSKNNLGHRAPSFSDLLPGKGVPR